MTSSAAALVYSPEFADEVLSGIAGAARAPQTVLCTDGTEPSLATLLANNEPKFEAVPATAEDDCFWLYSSGSTGQPKAAVHRHRDMVITSQRFGVETLGIREDDVFYSEAKLFFAYGLGNNLTFPLWVGATAVLNEHRPGPATSFPLIRAISADALFWSANALCRILAAFFERETGSLLGPAMRIGWRGASGRNSSALARRNRPLDFGWYRFDRSAAHFHFKYIQGHQARIERPCRPRIFGTHPGRARR